MKPKVYKYANGGEVKKAGRKNSRLDARPDSGAKLPGPETRRMPPVQLPKPKRYADGGAVTKKPKPTPPPSRDTVQSPKPASTADALRNQRKRQESALGLRNGGMVRATKRGKVC